MTQNFNEIASNCEKKILPVFVPEEFIHQVKYVNQVHLAKCVCGGEDLLPHTHNEDIAQWQSVFAWYT